MVSMASICVLTMTGGKTAGFDLIGRVLEELSAWHQQIRLTLWTAAGGLAGSPVTVFFKGISHSFGQVTVTGQRRYQGLTSRFFLGRKHRLTRGAVERRMNWLPVVAPTLSVLT